MVVILQVTTAVSLVRELLLIKFSGTETGEPICMPVRLLETTSPPMHKPNFDSLVIMLGRLYALRDDYMNLSSGELRRPCYMHLTRTAQLTYQHITHKRKLLRGSRRGEILASPHPCAPKSSRAASCRAFQHV